jgi:hypothetical protein
MLYKNLVQRRDEEPDAACEDRVKESEVCRYHDRDSDNEECIDKSLASRWPRNVLHLSCCFLYILFYSHLILRNHANLKFVLGICQASSWRDCVSI